MAAGQQRFYLIFAAVAVAVLGWLGWKVFGAPDLPVVAAAGTRDTTGFQGYVLGSADAPVEIVEYADFQCPACAGFDQVQFPDLKRRLIDTGKARFIHRDFPFLPEAHPHARIASHAAACADDQGLFWQMKDRLYQSQGQWTFQKTRGAYGIMGDQFAQAGGNRAEWEACMESGRHAARIQASLEEGIRLGINGTPTFLIAGQLYPGGSSDVFVRVVDSLIAAGAAPTP
ncbi:MAG TPA: thioredoxin domain-containing protein [Gemmatimonadales bacterium]|nr:thioredoxin domain-containing protein [Gemmatimonadales bacterium]